jgi:hypothetical protein
MLNPTPTTADHWYNLEETSNSTTFDVFLEQLASNNPNNPNGFEIALQESPGSTFFAPIQIDPTGGHVGLHGVPNSAVKPAPDGLTAIDSIKMGAGPAITNSTVLPQVESPTVEQAACIKAVAPPVVIGFRSTVVSSTGGSTCN